MNSYFITGTDTDVGKTYVTAGLARALSNRGIDIGVMKPYAAGLEKHTEYKAKDVKIIATAANVKDDDALLNPYFFPIPASPYTAAKKLGIVIDNKIVLDAYRKLTESHQIMLIEGMGGILTPILKNYSIANLIQEFNSKVIIVTRTRIGTVNHTLMTCNVCKQISLPVHGIIINNFDTGYDVDELKSDLEHLTGIPVLGTLPCVDKFEIDSFAKIINDEIELDLLL